MTQQEWFKMIEHEKPGLLRKVWEDYLCLCTQETNRSIARDLTTHARLRGDDIVITVGGWRHYRTANGFVSRHRRKKPEESGSTIPDEVPLNGTGGTITSSRQAIDALEEVIAFLRKSEGFGISDAPHVEKVIHTLFGDNQAYKADYIRP